MDEGRTEERRKRVGAKREKSDTLVIKAEQSKYSDILKAMRSDAKLVETQDLRADARSIKRTRTGEMVLKLKRDKDSGRSPWRKGRNASFYSGLKMKNLDGVTEAEELVTALRQQCDVQVDLDVRLRKGPAGTLVALVQLPVADVKKFVIVGETGKVGAYVI